VLLGLLDAGFASMLRVGSLPRIAKRLLGVSLHSAGAAAAPAAAPGAAALLRRGWCVRAPGHS
jgi:hypothetical protein